MTDLEATSELLRLFSDPTRVRLLSLVAHEELSVAELTGVTRLSQSRVSTHLGRLKEAGLVRDRREGASCFYSLNASAMPEDTRRVWSVLCETAKDPLLEEDRERLREVIRARGGTWADVIRARGGTWADSVAGQMDRHYSPGRTWEAAARGLLGLAHLGDVLDVASGDGALAELVVRRARSVTCLDSSRRVIAAARRRLSHLPGVHFRVGDMHTLPFRDSAFDQVLFANALSYAEHPERAVREAARVLRPGGSLAAVTLKTHRHGAVARAYNHVQPGFQPRALRALFERAGFEIAFCEVTSREKRPPHFEILTLYAERLAESPAP
jgi:ArsR family transcriptional regulator